MTPQSTPVSARAANPDHALRSPARPFGRRWAPVVVAVAVLLSMFGVAGPAQAGTIHRTRAELSYGWAVLRLINAERHAHHLRALRYDPRLRVSARRHNLSMAQANMLSHQLPGEADFTRRITATG